MAEKKKKKNKQLRRQILVSAVALLLVAGLVFSAVFGFADYFLSGNQQMPHQPQEEDYISGLEGMVASLEEALAESPDDHELKMYLSEVYLELAMVYGSQGMEQEMDRYATKGEEILQQVKDDIPAHAELLLKLALLKAFYQDDDARAEEYFEAAVDLEQDNGEVHLYYGMFLSLNEREEEAQVHLEKVLELEPEDSYLAELARLSMEGFGEDGVIIDDDNGMTDAEQ